MGEVTCFLSQIPALRRLNSSYVLTFAVDGHTHAAFLNANVIQQLVYMTILATIENSYQYILRFDYYNSIHIYDLILIIRYIHLQINTNIKMNLK